MTPLSEIQSKTTVWDMIEGQPQHLAILALMLGGVAWVFMDETGVGQFWGMDSLAWAWMSIWLAVLHQIIVAIGFRAQLHLGVFSRFFRDRDMRVWAGVFFPLLLARPVTLLIVASLDQNSLGLPVFVRVVVGLALFLPAAYAMFSVAKYFGFGRAMGGDHFRDSYRKLPLVKEGAFRFTDNAMYGLAFLGLWSFAIFLGSWQALIVAAFQHTYIWVHMYTVEAPDMRWLYEDSPAK